MHVACTLPNASHRIDGKLYVPIELNKQLHHVSENLTEAEGKRLLQIPGFELFRGDPKLVEQAVRTFKESEVKAVFDDGDKDRTIAELQRTATLLSDQLGTANMRVMELMEENAELKKQIGEPSSQWPRKRLAEYAEGLGLAVNANDSKEEILEMVESRIAQRG